MKVSFEGIGEQVISFKKGNGTEKGLFVKMGANATASACSAGDDFMGLCIHADGAFCEVMTHGYMECAYSGSAPAVGYSVLVADAGGKVKTAASGRSYLVINVDTTAKTVGFMM